MRRCIFVRLRHASRAECGMTAEDSKVLPHQTDRIPTLPTPAPLAALNRHTRYPGGGHRRIATMAFAWQGFRSGAPQAGKVACCRSGVPRLGQ